MDPDELVTGEHSGMRVLPQQTADNPHLAPPSPPPASSGSAPTTPATTTSAASARR
ncbi:hypothetical protein ACFQX7_31070 [Luedemannella flava]